MRKLKVLLIAGILLFSTSAFAAWTCTEQNPREFNNGSFSVEVSCTSDASASDYTISTYASKIRGMFLYELKVIPGTGDDEPSATFDVDLEDDEDDHILDTNDNAVDANTFHAGNATLDFYPMVTGTLSIVSETLGNGNTAVYRLMFAGGK